MRTIYKYKLDPDKDIQEIIMPQGAEIIKVAALYNDLCIWAIVNTEKELLPRTFCVEGTGQGITNRSTIKTYVGTAFMPTGLVWHVFDLD